MTTHKDYAMKALLFCCFLAFSGTCFGQATISGNTIVKPGSIEVYYVNFPFWEPGESHAGWYVSGGTKIYGDDRFCIVRWNNTNGTGYINVEDYWYVQGGELEVRIGDPIPSISPSIQTFSYGTAPGQIDVLFGFSAPISASYQWQEWNPINAQWEDLSQIAKVLAHMSDNS